jgi:hypothetical protein
MKFKVSKTYNEVTPESAEHGDFSDTGYVFQDVIYTLSELKQLIKSEGFRRESRGTSWLSCDLGITCYQTHTETEENLHIELVKE